MKVLHRAVVLAGCVGGLLAFAPAASATPYLSVDFQGDTAGVAPTDSSISYYYHPTGAQAMVVDSSTTPADPFGGTGNKSMWLSDTALSPFTQITFNGGGTGLATGTASFDFYTPTPTGSDTTFTQIWIGTNNVTADSDIGAYLQYNEGTLKLSEGGPLKTLDNSIALDTVHHVIINFDNVAHTMTGTVDGLPMKIGSQTSFGFYHNLADFTSITFKANSTNRTGQAFYDNISLTAVPEPATLSLLGLGGLLALSRRRRRIV